MVSRRSVRESSQVCGICARKHDFIGWCTACRKAWDRARNTDDGTVLAAMHWAARRARWFAGRRQ